MIEARFEFQTWLLAPCLGDIEDGTLMEVQPGGGNPATGLLPCETFPAQPEQPMRIPVGRVEWGFTTTVTVGKDADSTSARVDGSYYRWIEGAPPATSPYVQLMTNNYPDWVPP